ncbi:hypothetical protein RA24_02700 [Leisingera sp. ANG-M6]|nr:hypothetical protein RA21_14095 [Leisingera sp. ANG-DT]KIC30248.1 hypothetical protein RA24_02700 [Leisingera sp. ANG-M6]
MPSDIELTRTLWLLALASEIPGSAIVRIEAVTAAAAMGLMAVPFLSAGRKMLRPAIRVERTGTHAIQTAVQFGAHQRLFTAAAQYGRCARGKIQDSIAT